MLKTFCDNSTYSFTLNNIPDLDLLVYTYEEDHEFGPVSSPDVEIREKKYTTNANLVMKHWRSYLRTDTYYESAHTSSNIL